MITVRITPEATKRADRVPQSAGDDILADGLAEGERRASQDCLLGAVVADIIANAEDGQHSTQSN